MLPNLGVDTLFRTALPSSDPNYLPSCTGRTDPILRGMIIPDDDPTKPYRYWWDDNGTGNYTIWDGTQFTPLALSPAEAKVPNLPGIETYPTYIVPVTNAMWVRTPGFPPNTFPSSWLSQQADATALVAMFPGAVLLPGEAALPQAVFNLGNTPPAWQPWVMKLPDGTLTFAGGLIESMYGPNAVNGGGIGNPGSFVNYAWVPKPHPNGQSISTLGPPCISIPAGYKLARVQNGITFIYQLVPISGEAITVPPGTYVIDTSNGVVTFTPIS
jgi:hypothetical protein